MSNEQRGGGHQGISPRLSRTTATGEQPGHPRSSKPAVARAARIAATALLAVAGFATVHGCGPAQTPPFDPRSIHQLQREGDTRAYSLRPLPTTMESPIATRNRPPSTNASRPTTGPSLTAGRFERLTLRQVIQRTAANNSDVKVASYNPAIEGTRTTEAEARFDPTLFVNTSFERRDNATAGSQVSNPNNAFNLLTLRRDSSKSVTSEAGLRQNLFSGAQAQISYRTVWTDFDQPRFLTNPYYENSLNLQITQPLLRDFGTDVNRARITISRNSERIALLEFRRTLEEQLFLAEQTYWQLVQAERDVRSLEALVDRTERTSQIILARAQAGADSARIEVAQSDADVQFRRSQLVEARARVGNLSDQIKRLMADPGFPIDDDLLLLPATAPLEEPVIFDVREQFDQAMEHRFELGQQQLRIDNAAIVTRVAVNNLLPQLNLVGNVSVQGLDDQIGGAFMDQANLDHISAGIGIQFEIPIGNVAARSILLRSRLQEMQAQYQYKSAVEQVKVDVSSARRAVESTWNQMVNSRLARMHAADALSAIERRQGPEFGIDALNPQTVRLRLDLQAGLTRAEQEDNNNTAQYNIALARLERAKGLLLKYNNIVLKENPNAGSVFPEPR